MSRVAVFHKVNQTLSLEEGPEGEEDRETKVTEGSRGMEGLAQAFNQEAMQVSKGKDFRRAGEGDLAQLRSMN